MYVIGDAHHPHLSLLLQRRGHHAAALGSRPLGVSTLLLAVLHLSLTSPRWARRWSSAGVSPRARFVGLAGFPGTQAGTAGGHRAPVGLVVRAEAAGEGGFRVAAYERCDYQRGD